MNYAEEHKEIIQKGYQFDPELEVFYVQPGEAKKFKKPEGYEDFTVEEKEKDWYFEERVIDELGLTEDENIIDLEVEGKMCKNKIFTVGKKGDIEISCYTLHRRPFTYSQKGSQSRSSVNPDVFDVITRFTPHREKLEGRKYNITGKTGIHPFFHPEIIRLFEDREEIKTLVITEGYFKAFKATKEGIPTIGLSSITHYRDKEADSIHPEIIELIKTCKVKNIVILWDGDARDISSNAVYHEEDLYKRPGGFFSAASKMRDLLKEYTSRNQSIFFARIKSEAIPGNPKGIDDLIIKQNDQISRIIEDFQNIASFPGYYIDRLDIKKDSKELKNYFKISSAEAFYRFHQDTIKEREFIFLGTKYKWNEEQDQLDIIIPGALKKYVRVGTEYFRHIDFVNQNEEKIPELAKWKKETIIQDHGKEALRHIPKLLRFVNVPSHDNYQKVIGNCYNRYFEIDHNPSEGEWPHIEKYLKHVFDEQYEFVLDYLQLLYQKPQQKLPIIALVSEDQETGKSTFISLLKMIFQSNVTSVGNAELSSEFNSGWVTKLIVGVEETLIDKETVVNKIKTASTEKTYPLRQMHADLVEIDIFAKFVFTSNKEDDFIRLEAKDRRFWVRKVPVLKEKDPLFDQKMKNELDHFIYFLQNRKLHVPKALSRMWFDPITLETDAYRKLKDNSTPGAVKEIKSKLSDMFMDFGDEEIEMSLSDIKTYFRLRYEENYIKKLLKNHVPHKRSMAKNSHKISPKRYKFKWWSSTDPDKGYDLIEGRACVYIFHKDNFIDVNKGKQLKIK